MMSFSSREEGLCASEQFSIEPGWDLNEALKKSLPREHYAKQSKAVREK